MAVTEPTQHAEPAAPAWRDRKRHLWPLGLLIPLLPFIAWGLASATGLGVFWWWGPIFLYLLLPIIDTLVGADASNPPEAKVVDLDADRYYRWLTYLFLPLQYVATAWAAWKVVTGHLPFLDALGLTLTTGVVNGVAINTAHELGHKRIQVERWLSKVALAPTGYGHFFIEHNRGHHVRVATPDDPASARLGESFWAFWPRTVKGSFLSAWRLEAARLGRSGTSAWSLGNDLWSAWAMTVVVWAALTGWLGWRALPFLVVQAVFGFSLLEVVNYLEHYGLRRQREANGRYERCRPEHSWNANNVPSNLVLYQLQRHSDHHANPTRRYQSLRHFDEAPQLPSGYGTMITLAYLTPLWRRVMDPRVAAHYGGDLRRAAIQPGKERRYLGEAAASTGHPTDDVAA